MRIYSILLLLSSNAVCLIRDKSILYARVVIIIFIFSFISVASLILGMYSYSSNFIAIGLIFLSEFYQTSAKTHNFSDDNLGFNVKHYSKWGGGYLTTALILILYSYYNLGFNVKNYSLWGGGYVTTALILIFVITGVILLLHAFHSILFKYTQLPGRIKSIHAFHSILFKYTQLPDRIENIQSKQNLSQNDNFNEDKNIIWITLSHFSHIIFNLKFFNDLIVKLYLYIANNKSKLYLFLTLPVIFAFNENISFLCWMFFILCLTFIYILELAYIFIKSKTLDIKDKTNNIKNILYICALIFIFLTIIILGYYIMFIILKTEIWPSNIDPRLNPDYNGGDDGFNPNNNNKPNKDHYYSSASNSDNEEEDSESDQPVSKVQNDVAESRVSKLPDDPVERRKQLARERQKRWYDKKSQEEKQELAKGKYEKLKTKETPEKIQARRERHKADYEIRKVKEAQEVIKDRQKRKWHKADISLKSKRKARESETPEQRERRLAYGREYFQRKKNERHEMKKNREKRDKNE